MNSSPTSRTSPLHRKTPVLIVVLIAGVALGVLVASDLDLTAESVAESVAELNPEIGSAATAQRVEANANNTVASFADLAEVTLPAVATIRATTIRQTGASGSDSVNQDFFRRFFRGPDGQPQPGAPNIGAPPRDQRDDGTGSGFVVSPDGWVVTNNHVIDEATRVVVRLGEREYDATIHGQDPATDLALLKIDADGPLPYLSLGDSQALRVGEWVMAIGSPLSYGASVTVGIVSAKGRSIGINDSSFENYIQTDAAINRGNSGGPLVNTAGEVIGISTAMNYGAENIGFAVPVDTLKGILPQLRDEGVVRRGYLGVRIRDLQFRDMEAFGLDSTDGALISAVPKGTPADKAGLDKGDIIVRVDDYDVENNRDLIDYVSSKTPGDRVNVEVIRNGKKVDKEILLEERESIGEIAEISVPEEPDAMEWLGVQLQDIDGDSRRQLELDDDVQGVLVTQVAPTSPLYEERVQPYDIITEVNGQPVSSATDFEEVVSSAKSGKLLRLYLESARADTGYFAIVRVP